MRDRTKETVIFEEMPVLQAILRLALPTIVGQVILVVYNMADTFFIGQTGSDAMITAVTICMPAFMFLSAISNLFGVGGSSVISRSLGHKDIKRAKAASRFSFWGCLIVSAVYSLGAWLLIDPFVNILGGSDPVVHQNAVGYMTVAVVLGGMPTAMNTFLSHLVRSEGRSLHASVGIALGGVLNIALDPLFMFVLLPKGQEALGAAIATGLSNVIALVYFCLVIARNHHSSVLRFRPRKACLRDGVPRDILIAGLPACLMTLFENISYAVLDNLMSLAGTAMQAGIGVAKKVNMLAHCVVRGMSLGVLPLIGYNYASGNHRRMQSVIRLSMALSVCMAALCMGVFLTFSNGLIGVFIQGGGDSVTYGARFLRILCIGGPFSACAYAIISFFQAVGEGPKSFLLAILRKGVLDIPMMFILQRVYPVFGIVWATPIADVVCSAAALILFTRFLHKRLGLKQKAAGPDIMEVLDD